MIFNIVPNLNNKNILNYFRKYDEYYTRYENVEDIFNRYIPE